MVLLGNMGFDPWNTVRKELRDGYLSFSGLDLSVIGSLTKSSSPCGGFAASQSQAKDWAALRSEVERGPAPGLALT